MGAGEEIKKLAEFLPEEAKQQIFSALLEHYSGEKPLADALGLDVSLIKIWQSGESTGKERFPEILALALQECPLAKKVVASALSELSFVCDGLGIVEKEAQEDRANEFMDALDEESRTVVWHLIRKGHAKIGELSALISSNDSMALGKINEVINPTAKRILGKPILVFREAAFDSGKKAWFSWWIDEGMQLPGSGKKEIMEIINEKDFLRVTIALPGFEEADIGVSLGNGCLSISGKNAGASVFKKVPLYCQVKGIREKTFHNGILEIKLELGGQDGLCQISKELNKNLGSPENPKN